MQDKCSQPRLLLLLLATGVGACSPAATPVINNPLLSKMDMLTDEHGDPRALSTNLSNAVWVMGNICEAAIVHNDPKLIKALDPTECDKQAYSMALTLTDGLKINVTPDMLKDPSFWRAWRSALTARNKQMKQDRAARIASKSKVN